MSDIRSLALSRAYELVEAGKSDEARTVLEPILVNAPDNIDAWWIYAHAVDDPQDARRALENVLRIDPQYAGAAELLETLNDEYPPEVVVPAAVEPVFEAEVPEPEPDYDLDEPPTEQRPYEPVRVPTAKEPSRSWLPVAIVAGIILLLFVVLVLILPSLSGTVSSTPTPASVAGNTTPQATTPLLIAETEEMTDEAIILPEDTAAPTVEIVNTPVEDTTETALLPTEAEAATEEAVVEDETVTEEAASTEQRVTLAVTTQILPTDSPEPEESTQPSVELSTTRTTMSEVGEGEATAETETVEPELTAMAESVPTELSDVEYTEYLAEALQTFALSSPAIEDAETSYGATVLARVCTNEGLELRETLRSVMEILAHESDVVPEEFTGIGVRLIDCSDDSTLRIISVDRDSVSTYVSGNADESEFEAQWRAQ